MNNNALQVIKDEWCSGVLLNPFWLIDDYVPKLFSEITRRNTKGREKQIGEICMEIAEIFLKCTSYRVYEEEMVREGEKSFLTTMFLYLYCEAPHEEQNLPMICELAWADITGDYTQETNLQRLFNMLVEKNDKHESLKHFKTYLNNSAGREKIIKSLIRRLRPLSSFRIGDDFNIDVNIFDNCGADEVFDMAVTLLHNCWKRPENPFSLKDKTNEIAFVAAALHLIHDAYTNEEQTARTLFMLLDYPAFLDSEINENPQAVNAVKYWNFCKDNILQDKYDKRLVYGIEKFYEFK